MKIRSIYIILSGFFILLSGIACADEISLPDNPALSPQTKACIGCHKLYTPGIVQDWLLSRHSKTFPSEAVKKPVPERRFSAESLPSELSGFAVGCFECHSLNKESHRDNFDHMGYRINVIVSPNDCKTCHPVEVKQFSGSKKAHAINNLLGNPVYHMLVNSIDGLRRLKDNSLISNEPSEMTLNETCLGCHGAKVSVKGMKKVFTKTQLGEITVPDLSNWPNQGIGRGNPDGSFGACTTCHPRHSFLIEIARKPYTCGQCHLEPDVPAYNVYQESKHGNIYSSKGETWDWSSVPWKPGIHFRAPTCAVCHNSLLVSQEGNIIIARSHDFGARLWVRLFGLIYSVPQPLSGDTTVIRNKDGLPLPVTFRGEPASEYLIDKRQQEDRLDMMKKVCSSCHSTDWTDGHFEKLENTVRETNEMTLSATGLMSNAWSRGIEDASNPFDETIERMWIRQWLFYSNSIRYSSAMTGAYDYSAFKLGWWELSGNLNNMKDMIELKKPINVGGAERR